MEECLALPLQQSCGLRRQTDQHTACHRTVDCNGSSVQICHSSQIPVCDLKNCKLRGGFGSGCLQSCDVGAISKSSRRRLSQRFQCGLLRRSPRSSVSEFLSSCFVVVFSLLVILTNVGLSTSSEDSCPKVNWSSAVRCNCTNYQVNDSTCMNISAIPGEEVLSCECGTNMICILTEIDNSNSSQTFDGQCTCRNGYSGMECEKPPFDHCSNITCENGGSCLTNGTDSAYCLCSTGYTGFSCETKIFDCNATDACAHNGTCVYDGGYNKCNCTEGYEELNCSRPNCSLVHCQNHGKCYINESDWFCDCTEGFSGDDCSSYDPCFSDPCPNNGTCLPSNDSSTYHCICSPPFTGVNCMEMNHCEYEPCINGNCSNSGNGYNCSCLHGYTGVNCSEDDYCASEICHNGNCSSATNGFSCSCFPGFTGVHCNITDPCFENPCINGGLCNNLVHNSTRANCSVRGECFSCTCFANFTGSTCETSVVSDESSGGPPVGLIVGLTVGLFFLVVIIVVIIVLVVIVSKRKNLGTYRPSRQEVANARLEINGGLKPPPEERLI